jgi:hypothetical protein
MYQWIKPWETEHGNTSYGDTYKYYMHRTFTCLQLTKTAMVKTYDAVAICTRRRNAQKWSIILTGLSSTYEGTQMSFFPEIVHKLAAKIFNKCSNKEIHFL